MEGRIRIHTAGINKTKLCQAPNPTWRTYFGLVCPMFFRDTEHMDPKLHHLQYIHLRYISFSFRCTDPKSLEADEDAKDSKAESGGQFHANIVSLSIMLFGWKSSLVMTI